MDGLNFRFTSFESLKEFISRKEEEEYIQLWVERSRTIDGARKKGLKRYVNKDLKYYEITYKCIHSGSWKSKSTGKRPNRSTYRQGCPFHLRLKLSSDGNSLDVQEFNDDHNHEHSKEMYSFLPRQRQLEESSKELTKQMLKLQANKKLIKVQLLRTCPKLKAPTTSEKLMDVSSSKTITVPSQQSETVTTKIEKLSHLASQASPHISSLRIKALEEIISLWEKNIEVKIGPLTKSEEEKLKYEHSVYSDEIMEDSSSMVVQENCTSNNLFLPEEIEEGTNFACSLNTYEEVVIVRDEQMICLESEAVVPTHENFNSSVKIPLQKEVIEKTTNISRPNTSTVVQALPFGPLVIKQSHPKRQIFFKIPVKMKPVSIILKKNIR